MNTEITHAPSRDGLVEDVCEHCQFSHFGISGDTGECRESPPVPLLVPQQKEDLRSGNMVMVMTVQGAFPPVARRGYCHAFEPREDAKTD